MCVHLYICVWCELVSAKKELLILCICDDVSFLIKFNLNACSHVSAC